MPLLNTLLDSLQAALAKKKEEQAAAGVPPPPAGTATGASQSGVSSASASILAPLESALSDALTKSTQGVVDNAKQALNAEITQVESTLAYTLLAGAAGALLYTPAPMLGAGIAAAAALLYQAQNM